MGYARSGASRCRRVVLLSLIVAAALAGLAITLYGPLSRDPEDFDGVPDPLGAGTFGLLLFAAAVAMFLLVRLWTGRRHDGGGSAPGVVPAQVSGGEGHGAAGMDGPEGDGGAAGGPDGPDGGDSGGGDGGGDGGGH